MQMESFHSSPDVYFSCSASNHKVYLYKLSLQNQVEVELIKVITDLGNMNSLSSCSCFDFEGRGIMVSWNNGIIKKYDISKNGVVWDLLVDQKQETQCFEVFNQTIGVLSTNKGSIFIINHVVGANLQQLQISEQSIKCLAINKRGFYCSGVDSRVHHLKYCEER